MISALVRDSCNIGNDYLHIPICKRVGVQFSVGSRTSSQWLAVYISLLFTGRYIYIQEALCTRSAHGGRGSCVGAPEHLA